MTSKENDLIILTENKLCDFFFTVYCVFFLIALFRETESHFGRPDILVNNAGILDDSKWELEIAIDLVK